MFSVRVCEMLLRCAGSDDGVAMWGLYNRGAAARGTLVSATGSASASGSATTTIMVFDVTWGAKTFRLRALTRHFF